MEKMSNHNSSEQESVIVEVDDPYNHDIDFSAGWEERIRDEDKRLLGESEESIKNARLPLPETDAVQKMQDFIESQNEGMSE